MNRRTFLKTIAAGAVTTVLPIPGSSSVPPFEKGKTYTIEKTYDSGEVETFHGVPGSFLIKAFTATAPLVGELVLNSQRSQSAGA